MIDPNGFHRKSIRCNVTTLSASFENLGVTIFISRYPCELISHSVGLSFRRKNKKYFMKKLTVKFESTPDEGLRFSIVADGFNPLEQLGALEIVKAEVFSKISRDHPKEQAEVVFDELVDLPTAPVDVLATPVIEG